jgi:hypothetical protein
MYLGQNMLAIKVDHAPLIRLARVNVHCCSAAEKFDQRFGVNIGSVLMAICRKPSRVAARRWPDPESLADLEC